MYLTIFAEGMDVLQIYQGTQSYGGMKYKGNEAEKEEELIWRSILSC